MNFKERLSGRLSKTDIIGIAELMRDDSMKEELYRHNPAGTLDRIALLDALIRTKDDDGYGIFFQVLGHAEGAVGEFHQFTGHALVQAGGLGNAVADEDDHAGFAHFDLILIVFDLTANDFRYFFRSKFHTVPAF